MVDVEGGAGQEFCPGIGAFAVDTEHTFGVVAQRCASARVTAATFRHDTGATAENQPGIAFANPLGVARLRQVVAAGRSAWGGAGVTTDEVIVALPFGTAATG